MYILDFLSQHWAFLSLIFYVLSGYVIWKLTAKFVTRDEFAQATERLEYVEKSLVDIGKTLQLVETRMASLPDGGAINQILLGIEELRGQQRALREVFDMSSQNQKEAICRLEKQVDMLVTGHLSE